MNLILESLTAKTSVYVRGTPLFFIEDICNVYINISDSNDAILRKLKKMQTSKQKEKQYSLFGNQAVNCHRGVHTVAILHAHATVSPFAHTKLLQ